MEFSLGQRHLNSKLIFKIIFKTNLGFGIGDFKIGCYPTKKPLVCPKNKIKDKESKTFYKSYF